MHPMNVRSRLTSPRVLFGALLAYWAVLVGGFAILPPYPTSPRLGQGALAIALAVCAAVVARTRIGRSSGVADGSLAVLAVCAAVNAVVVQSPQGQVLTGLPVVLGAMFAGYFLPPARMRLQLAFLIGGYLLATRVNPLIPSLLYPFSVAIAALVAAGLVRSLTSHQQAQIRFLSETLDSVRTLSGLLPICAHCKRVRNDGGYWDRIEQYVSDRTGTLFSHGLCPNCLERFERDAGLAHEPAPVSDAAPARQPSAPLPDPALPDRGDDWHVPGAPALVLLALMLGLLGFIAANFAVFPPYPDTPRLLNLGAALILGTLAVTLLLARRSEPAPLTAVALVAYTTWAAVFAATSPTPQGQVLDALPVMLAGVFASYLLPYRLTALQLAWGLGTYIAGMVANPLITSPLYVLSVTMSALVATALVGTLAGQQRERIRELQDALDHVRTLSGLLPICMYCKSVRNDEGYWERVDEYLAQRTEASFSLGLCPECEADPAVAG